ncbi:tripartite tricarboxylate transporter permease [Ornithinimicrobium faecis]|uniref:Tripartite tricarboxylate transporter permease n=1 Tax=Ornithinimicrobium faecis TaxID=2934158 RepID=A0ABY4YZ37_9MICO|nr:tripartite tricarboxylate transporter permease [Ornithinimicrobium sp. HY1793]USQ81387.1 tripartite tricarboxylate transporter permease [Ornithinimicrobium sp. HY1793]
MDIFDGIATGFATAATPHNLLYVFIGVLIGTVIGVLPGLGPSATIALLLPLTYTLEPATAIIMLAGIYYGSMYGGTITSVLLRLPGEAASVVTSIDGYEMAKQGRAGPALGISAVGSFIGGMVAVVGLMLLAPTLAEVAVGIGPPEFVALAVLGLLLVTYLGTRHPFKSLAMAAVGLLLATVGQDPITGATRFTFGQLSLIDGFDFVAIAMGLFGVGEILHAIEQDQTVKALTSKVRNIWPTRQDFRDSAAPIARGSVLGFFIGVLPGGGGVVSSLASYGAEKKFSKNSRHEFGKGAIEGVAGPETANNASSTSAFVPLLTLGLPSNVVLALIFGALTIQGITPGPSLIDDHPDIFWGVIASMVIGNIILLILNVPLVGIFVQLLRVRPGILGAFALLITLAGVYSINSDLNDMWVVLGFGILGWLMKKTGFEPGPLVLAFVLGPILEGSFRQSMLLSDGSLGIFIQRPVAGVVFGLIAVFLVWSTVMALRGRFTSGKELIEHAAMDDDELEALGVGADEPKSDSTPPATTRHAKDD